MLGRAEVAACHARNMGSGIARPRAHQMRIPSCILLHAIGRAAVGVAFAQDGIDGASLHLVISRPDSLLFVICRLVWIVWQVLAFFFKLPGCCLSLEELRAD